MSFNRNYSRRSSRSTRQMSMNSSSSRYENLNRRQRRYQDNSRRRTYNPYTSRHSTEPKRNKMDSWYHKKMAQEVKTSGKLPKGKGSIALAYIVLFILMMISILAFLPFNRANAIVTKGRHHLSHEDILNATGIHPVDRLKEIKRQEKDIIEQAFENDVLIEDLTFDYQDVGGLTIYVDETLPLGWTQLGGQPFIVLSNGLVVLPSNLQNIEELPYLYDYHTEGLEKLGEQWQHIPKDFIIQIEAIYFSTNPNKPNTIELKMRDGNIIKASLPTFYEKIHYYPQMVEQVGFAGGIFNLEVGAYFTPYYSRESIKLDSNLQR